MSSHNQPRSHLEPVQLRVGQVAVKVQIAEAEDAAEGAAARGLKALRHLHGGHSSLSFRRQQPAVEARSDDAARSAHRVVERGDRVQDGFLGIVNHLQNLQGAAGLQSYWLRRLLFAASLQDDCARLHEGPGAAHEAALDVAELEQRLEVLLGERRPRGIFSRVQAVELAPDDDDRNLHTTEAPVYAI